MAARVYRRGNSWVVTWQASRSVATYQEAAALAEQPMPPPRCRRETSVPVETVVRIRQARFDGVSYAEIGRQLEADGIRPPRARCWGHATLRQLV